ncbi:peptidyl-prolyl cis-trans isomerase FKBP3-like [Watersipora subatra]|uniref:peptidyl-prolyl cis-trans isomerase FKBP3-like n=1 Tax=Watersipora subatra TaxID=2589382 RepID=UPI00355C6C1C
MDVELPWTEEVLKGETVGKKEVIAWIQEHATFQFLAEKKLKGALKNIAKIKSKDDCIKFYVELCETKAFRKEGDVDESSKSAASAGDSVEKMTAATAKLEVDSGPPKFKKSIQKKGNKINYPQKGDTVKVYYKGSLENGKVFDTNIHAQRRGKIQPLAFKVGKGIVIRGWDEALLTMSLGEKAEITIEPEWAYGKRGLEGKIPPNARLIFEVELMAIE